MTNTKTMSRKIRTHFLFTRESCSREQVVGQVKVSTH